MLCASQAMSVYTGRGFLIVIKNLRKINFSARLHKYCQQDNHMPWPTHACRSTNRWLDVACDRASASSEELQRAPTNAGIMAHLYHHHPMDEYEERDRRELSLDACDGSRSRPVPP